MATLEYIEYFEDDLKIEIKSEVEDMELFQHQTNAEYFEEDVKEEIVEEKNPYINLVTFMCNICSKRYNSKVILT